MLKGQARVLMRDLTRRRCSLPQADCASGPLRLRFSRCVLWRLLLLFSSLPRTFTHSPLANKKGRGQSKQKERHGERHCRKPCPKIYYRAEASMRKLTPLLHTVAPVADLFWESFVNVCQRLQNMANSTIQQHTP